MGSVLHQEDGSEYPEHDVVPLIVHHQCNDVPDLEAQQDQCGQEVEYSQDGSPSFLLHDLYEYILSTIEERLYGRAVHPHCQVHVLEGVVLGLGLKVLQVDVVVEQRDSFGVGVLSVAVVVDIVTEVAEVQSQQPPLGVVQGGATGAL